MPPMSGQGQRGRKSAEAPEKPGDEQPAAAADGDALPSGGLQQLPADDSAAESSSQNTDKTQRRRPGVKGGAAAQTDEKSAGTDAVTDSSQNTDKTQRRRPGAKDEAAAGTNSKGPKGGRRKKAPTAAAQAPDAIDFDAMVQSGVISAETRERIRTYIDSETADASTGATPAPAEKPGSGAPQASASLLDRLLAAGVITQAEYDALTAAQTNTAVTM